jgi:hypothetical protein
MKRRIAMMLTTAGIVVALGTAPVRLQDTGFGLGSNPALATPGNGHGHGHGDGNGHSKSQGSLKGVSNEDGVSSSNGRALGHAKAVDGVIGSKVKGAFNAVHASPTAMANAAPTSQVANVKAYLDAVSAEDIDVEAAAEAAAIAAKNHTVTAETLDGVHEIANSKGAEISVDDVTTQEIADRAADIQAGGLDGEAEASQDDNESN